MKKSLPLFVFIIFPIILLGQPFSLPTLPFAYDQYAPQIDAKTMEIHLTKHHQAYVNNLNKTIKGTTLESLSLEDLLFFPSEKNEIIKNNAGGHYNHSLFWEILAPIDQQKGISYQLEHDITLNFGGLDSLKKMIFSAATTRFGSGWAWLVVTPKNGLKVSSSPNQDNPIMAGTQFRGIPILAIDVWEHAYYLNYQNRRNDYLNAIWTLLNWGEISVKYDQALQSKLLNKIEKDWPALNQLQMEIANLDFIEANGGHQLIYYCEKLYSSSLTLNTIPNYYQKNNITTMVENIISSGAKLNKLKKKHNPEKLNKEYILFKNKIKQLQESCERF